MKTYLIFDKTPIIDILGKRYFAIDIQSENISLFNFSKFSIEITNIEDKRLQNKQFILDNSIFVRDTKATINDIEVIVKEAEEGLKRHLKKEQILELLKVKELITLKFDGITITPPLKETQEILEKKKNQPFFTYDIYQSDKSIINIPQQVAKYLVCEIEDYRTNLRSLRKHFETLIDTCPIADLESINIKESYIINDKPFLVNNELKFDISQIVQELNIDLSEVAASNSLNKNDILKITDTVL